MKKIKETRKKVKQQNTKKQESKKRNFPAFLLCGLILIIIIISILYYLFLYYMPQTIIPYSGYAIEPKVILANLQNQSTSQVEEIIKMIKVEEDETVFRKLNSYYIGENQKKKIDINYPIYIKENSAICNLSKDTKLITVNYEEVEGYPEFTVVDGVMYNGDDLLRADSNEYLFLKSKENIYTNTKEIEIKTNYNKYKIQNYSNIYFTEDRIAYYIAQDGIMQYHNIGDIDEISKVTINGKESTYKEFLIKMKIIQEEKEKEEKIEQEEKTEKEENIIKEEEVVEEPKKEETEDIAEENKYQKPEITLTELEAKVYTITGTLKIKDISGAITKTPILEIRKDGKIFKRIQLSMSGLIEIAGLIPDTEFDIKGISYYKNEEGEEKKETFLETKIQTKKLDTLGTIKLKYENGEIFSDKIQLKNFEIENNKQEEVIKGISKIEIIANGNTYRIKKAEINQMIRGEKITYETEGTIKSNTNVKYEIHIYDKYGNELKTENSKGETRTAKKPPSVIIKLSKQDITEVGISIDLRNEDNVNIENYRYSIYNMKDEEVSKGNLNNKQKEIVLKDLDPNNYYNISIFGDYDLGDGKGLQKDNILGKGKFITLPISSLGYVRLNINLTKVETYSSSIKLSINEDVTDKRLISILSYLEAKIVPLNEAGEKDKEKEEKSIIFDEEKLNKLKKGEELDIDFYYLNSNTKYEIQIIAKAKQGVIEEQVSTAYTTKDFTTLKTPAEVQIKNQFITGEMIDFDIRIEDIDRAILTDNVAIEFRDIKENLIARDIINTNEEYIRKTYNKLEEKQIYYLRIYANEYNEGNTDATYKNNYLLKEIQIYTEMGITGKLDLINLSRKGTGKNLINVESENNWYVYPNFNTYDYYGKEYNKETGELKLGGHSNTRRCVYNLKEYAGQTVTMSFKIKYVNINNKGSNIFIQNAKTDKNRTVINGITEEYTEKTYTLTLDESGYLGFCISGGEGIYIKDLQIELGDRKTNYEKFQYKIEAEFLVNIEDRKEEISTKDYYIRIYENEKQILEERYEEINEENKVIDSLKNYELQENFTYRVELLIKIRERYYILESQNFETEKGKEIKGILTTQDYLEIQPYGNYIVLNDIDMSKVGPFGTTDYERLTFNGKLDFNGHTITRTIDNSRMFGAIGETGIIENLVLNIKLNNQIEKSMLGFLFFYNRGLVRNLQLNVVESTKQPNSEISFIGYNNTGTIDRFVINLKEPVYCSQSINSITINYGIIKNGYLCGNNIKAIYNKASTATRNIAPLLGNNIENAQISNVYSLINVEFEPDPQGENSANLILVNSGNAIVNNVYSVGKGSISNLNSGPNISATNGTRISNNYYFTDEIFKNSYHQKTTKLALWDSTFQNQILNTEQAFIVDELVKSGYYPQINMPEVMPRQEFINLPEVTDKDLPDVLSTEVLEQGKNKVKVKFNVNNPSGEQITQIVMENINVKIISQEYIEGKSEVIAELYDPVKYISNYNLQSITTKGALNLPYTRNFKQGERIIRVDLYKEINSIQDWKGINSSPTENYILMTDLDFANEGKAIKISNIYKGKLNGNGHTIRNIFIENAELFTRIDGTLQNVKIENVRIKGNIGYRSIGIINATLGATIKNVHVKDVVIESEATSCSIGTLIAEARSYTTIKDCSVTNVSIKKTASEVGSVSIGGLVGYFYGAEVKNCFAAKVNINIKDAINSEIGGLIGKISSGIVESCYTIGTINVEKQKTGGICGYNTSTVVKIQNCYSDVEIFSKEEYVGGILGQDRNTSAKKDVSSNLSIGNIYIGKSSEMFSRAVGNSREKENNYAYIEQKINGYEVMEELGAKLLTYEQLCQESTYKNIIMLGNSYDYSKIENGVLPKLYNTEGTELLPNQEDTKINKEFELRIDEVIAEKADSNTVNVMIQINNPGEYPISEIEIENMKVSIQKNNTKDGKTYIEVKATPTGYYDSYKISKIIYTQSEEKKEQNVQAKIDIQFYKELYNYEDWQSIEIGTYQNYRLINDIDFTGKDDVKCNVTMSRFISDGKTLKNIDLTIDNGYGGLIQEVSTELQNINFENIIITNNKAKSYIGVIGRSTAKINNINFKNITIDTKSNYIGCIGIEYNESISNINMENIIIKGKTYIGGLVGQDEAQMSNIKATNITVEATGSDIGGIVGNAYESGHWDDYLSFKITDSNITGESYVGGIAGRCSRRLTDSIVERTTVKGVNYIGGMTGAKSVSSSLVCTNNIVDGCEIYGSGNNIGGLTGESTNYEHHAIVRNSKIIGESVNSKYIGGIFGKEGYLLWYSTVDNCEIISKGDSVGGISGRIAMNSQHAPRYCYVKNSKIEGNSKVGGVCGEIRDGPIINNLVNAKITAITDKAGGITGYMDNKDMTAAIMRINISNNIVANSKITAPTKVGGMVGDIEKDLYTESEFFYNNYVHAYLNCEDTENVSMGVGGSKSNNPTIKNTHIYKYSKINDQYMNEDIDNYTESQYVVAEDLKKEATYKSTFGLANNFNYTILKNNKYPLPAGNKAQEGIDLPEDPINTIQEEAKMLSAIYSLRNTVDLPNMQNYEQKEIGYDIYAISANEINIDLKNVEKGAVLKIGEVEIPVESRTYTFKYDFITTKTLKLMQNDKEIDIIIKPDEIKRYTSLEGENYAYIKNNKLNIKGTEIEGEFLHVYKNQALTNQGEIYNIESKSIDQSINKTEGLILEEEVKPRETYEYQGSKVQIFGKYSKIGQQVKQQIYTVRNGKLSILSSSLDMKIGQKVIDMVNEKEYETILKTDGTIEDLKEKLTYPEDFENSRIKEINQNTETEKPEMIVYYENGDIVIFNYLTGEVEYSNIQKENVNIIDYLKINIESLLNDITEENKNENDGYEEAKELAETLKEKPIEIALQEAGIENENSNNNTTNSLNKQNYITSYNPETSRYEVYSESEIVEGESEKPESETQKIESQGLEKFYSGQKAVGKDREEISGLVMIFVVIASIGICIFVGYRKMRKIQH